MPWAEDLPDAMRSAGVVIIDGPGSNVNDLAPYRVTAELLDMAPRGVRFVPCPPFVRGREVSSEALLHSAFVGYEFNRFVLPVHQAVMAHALA